MDTKVRFRTKGGNVVVFTPSGRLGSWECLGCHQVNSVSSTSNAEAHAGHCNAL